MVRCEAGVVEAVSWKQFGGVIPANRAGKLKAFSQNVAVVALLLAPQHRWIVDSLVGLAIVLSWLSLAGYLSRAWRHIVAGTA